MTIELPVVLEVRDFLAEQGVELRPSSGLDEALDSLHVLLEQRRADPEFWESLSALLQELADSTVGASQARKLPAPGPELLSSWSRQRVVQSLRDALPAQSRGDLQVATPFSRTFPAPLRTSFLLLGLAATGCSWHGTAGQDVPSEVEAQEVGTVAIEPSQVESPTVWQAIDRSSLDPADKMRLHECLIGDPREIDLNQLFQTATPEEIAAVLELELATCNEKDARDQERIMEPMPLYKGVSPRA